MAPPERPEAVAFNNLGAQTVHYRWNGGMRHATDYVNYHRRFCGIDVTDSNAYALNSLLLNQAGRMVLIEQGCASVGIHLGPWNRSIGINHAGANAVENSRYSRGASN